MRGINLQASIFAIVALAIVILVQGKDINNLFDRYGPGHLTRKRYLVAENVTFNWKDAAAYCSQHGFSIATIKSSEENEKLRKILRELEVNEKSHWIGARDPSKNGIFEWYPKNESLTYEYWHGIGPGRNYSEINEEHCLVMLGVTMNHTWHDNDCRYKNAVVCQEFTEDSPSSGENVLQATIN